MSMRGKQEEESRWSLLEHASDPFKSFKVLSIVFPWKRDLMQVTRRREILFENVPVSCRI